MYIVRGREGGRGGGVNTQNRLVLLLRYLSDVPGQCSWEKCSSCCCNISSIQTYKLGSVKKKKGGRIFMLLSNGYPKHSGGSLGAENVFRCVR